MKGGAIIAIVVIAIIVIAGVAAIVMSGSGNDNNSNNNGNGNGNTTPNPSTNPGTNNNVPSGYTPVYNQSDLGNIRSNSSGQFFLMNDIVLTSSWKGQNFSGILDGNGHTVYGLRIEKQSTSEAEDTGFVVYNSGTIKNLTINGANIVVSPRNFGAMADVDCGVIAAINGGQIVNCRVVDSSVSAYSTDIDTQYLSNHSSIPNVAADNNKNSNGSWAYYASLNFTGRACTSWSSNQKMVVHCGGICGLNKSNVDGCKVESTSVLGELINYHYNSNDPSLAQLYVGGITGLNSGTVKGCQTGANVRGVIKLHDSGEGDAEGLGYVATYFPNAKGYVGKICGDGNRATNSNSTGSATYYSESFAPGYEFNLFGNKGSNYSQNKGSTVGIKWTLS